MEVVAIFPTGEVQMTSRSPSLLANYRQYILDFPDGELSVWVDPNYDDEEPPNLLANILIGQGTVYGTVYVAGSYGGDKYFKVLPIEVLDKYADRAKTCPSKACNIL